MNCPYCRKKMVEGYIQCRDGVYWSEKLRPIAALPILGGRVMSLGGKAAVAYRCKKCKTVIIDYSSPFPE